MDKRPLEELTIKDTFMFSAVMTEDPENCRRCIELGRSEGVVTLIECLQEFGCSKEDAVHKLMDKYKLSKEDAEAKVAEHWQ